MAQKRISQIAKELGVAAKVIVEKCHAEGISTDMVKGHMSTVSAGLEASIREWFSGGGTATAVETSEKIHVDEVRAVAKPSRARKPKEGEDHAPAANGEAPAIATPAHAPAPSDATGDAAVSDQDHGGDRIVEPHMKATPTSPAISQSSISATPLHTPSETPAPARPAVSIPASSISSQPTPSRLTSRPGAPKSNEPPKAPPPPPGPRVVHASQPIAQSSISPTAPPSRPGDKSKDRPADRATPPAPPADGHARTEPHTKPDAQPEAHGRGEPHPKTDGHAPARPGFHGRSGEAGPGRGRPVQPNVPQRPTGPVIAGPKLENRTPVSLKGPKVVRIEAPEQVEAPRPRRVSPPGVGGARTGTGAGGSAEDDRKRSPRRNDAKRSSGTGVPDRRRGLSNTAWTAATPGTFSEQDLAEREARLARAGGFLKKRKQDASRPNQSGPAGPVEGRLRIASPFTLKDLSAASGVKVADISKRLFLMGNMTKINEAIEPEIAAEVMIEFNIDLDIVEAKTAEETVSSEFLQRESMDIRGRGPVVTILGHVDHGKTSLLDKIRNANVAAGEAGGITQKTSAFISEIEVEGNKKQVVFLDTPGHEAFTSMRARGAKMTDVVVLVVSAPEGVMPQTVESINHAKAAKVPIVVALNKIDRPDATEAQIQKTLGELAKAGLNPVEWGGDTEVIRTSATTGQGIKELLETLDYQSQLLDLKADFEGSGQGTVIESKMEEGRGAVASILMQQGRLKVGDFVVMGRAFGRVRDITDDKGQRVREAEPPLPVQISGIDVVCDAGDKFYVTDSLKKAMEAAEQRRMRERQIALAQPKVTLDNIFSQMTDKELKEILVVLKTDQQGTVDVLRGECEKVKSDEVRVRVLHAAVGGITESDIVLADASRAIVIGFNVIPAGKARQLADQKGIEIRTYQVIYDITDDLRKAAEGMLTPELREEVLGHAEVRQVFKISKVGSIAGCYVTDGTVSRDALIRVTRNGVVVEHDRKLSQLKRVKDDAKEVRSGLECGMKIDGYDDIKEGDVLECYKKVEVKRTL